MMITSSDRFMKVIQHLILLSNLIYIFHDKFLFLPVMPGECVSNGKPPSEKLRKSFSRSSCNMRSSLPPFDVEPGLCCNDRLLGTGEWVPNEISESESSDGVGDALSVCLERKEFPPDPESGG